MLSYDEIIRFWFQELERPQWWRKDSVVDASIRDRFSEHHKQAVRCELYYWRTKPLGRLAEIIVIDQFSRNLYRDSCLSFAADPLALALAQEAIALGMHEKLDLEQKAFLYMPFMHSESLKIHDISVELHSEKGLETRLHWEHKHRDIIKQFGRYPHRNQILGRESTPEELEFLTRPGTSF